MIRFSPLQEIAMPIDTPPLFDPPTPPPPSQAIPVPPDIMDVRPDAGSPLSQYASVSTHTGPTPTAALTLPRAAASFWLRGLSVGAASFPLIAVGGTALAQDAGLVETVGAAPGTWIHVVASAIQMLLFLGMRLIDQRGNDYGRAMTQLDASSRKLAQGAEDLAEARSSLKILEVELRLAKERLSDKQEELISAQKELRDAREALAHDALLRDSDGR
jgi:hypothetical protein